MAKDEFQTIGGIILFVVIMIILALAGVFGDIIKAFNIPEFGGWGLFLGILFILIIIVGFLQKLLEK